MAHGKKNCMERKTLFSHYFGKESSMQDLYNSSQKKKTDSRLMHNAGLVYASEQIESS